MKEINIFILNNISFNKTKRYIKHVLERGNPFLNIKKEHLSDSTLDSLSIGFTNSILVDCSIANYTPSYKNIVEEILNIGTKEHIESIKEISTNCIVKLLFVKIDLETIYKYSEKLVDISFEDAKYISNDPLDCKVESKKNVVSLIQSMLYIYDNEEPKDIVYLISNIFKSILVGHYLVNGNKRLASMILFNFLYIFCGLFLKLSTMHSKKLFWEVNEIKFIEFVEEYHKISNKKNFHEEDKKLLEKIYMWVYENIQIALNFID